MDSTVSENTLPRSLRRSTRQSSIKALSFEPTPRGPLKRSRRGSENQAPAVNGTSDVENGSDDDESPRKKNRLDTGEPAGSSGDAHPMDFQESAKDIETKPEQGQQTGQDPSPGIHQPKICKGALGDVNISPCVLLGERCQSSHAVNENADWIKTKIVRQSTREPAATIKSAVPSRNLVYRHDVPSAHITSMAEYKSTMKAKAKSAGVHIIRVNQHVPIKHPTSEKSFTTTRQRLNNIATQKENTGHKKQAGINKTAVTKGCSYFSCRGFMHSWWFFVLLVLLSSAVLLVYKKIPILQRTVDKGRYFHRAAKPEVFADYLSLLESQFPSQRAELWKRSKIHLERHLKTAHPTEPVSLILTAGLRAERTLDCLAKGLASSFSSVFNASVLHIDGASKASQDSDEVKLFIDTELEAAFNGDKPVAVIHRFEELPPGATLIFYRYCDHESAAFKETFLLFTVVLPQDEVSSEDSLQIVEEMVQDYVQERLVGSTNQTGFNKMDTDKFGGLWSRISHLILPVVSEKDVEQNGCK